MLLSRSTGRKVLVTATAAVAFASLYEVTTLDSRNVTRDLELRESTALPSPGARLRFSVTGYCKGTTTASGVNQRTGIDNLSDRYNGIYTIMDTGPAVKGRELDLYMWSCNEALALGRRAAAVTVVRLGWNPKASTPRLIDRLFRQSEAHLPTQPLEASAFPK